jgi:hypothetical protein
VMSFPLWGDASSYVLVDQYPVIEVQKAEKSWLHLGQGTAQFGRYRCRRDRWSSVRRSADVVVPLIDFVRAAENRSGKN